MKTLKQTDILDNKIAALKAKRDNEFSELKAQYFVVQNSITVFNLLEQGISEFYKTATNKNNLFTTITSIVGGYLSNKMVVGDSKNTFKKIIGYGVQFAVTKLLSKITNK
jgi:hypothetical protein